MKRKLFGLSKCIGTIATIILSIIGAEPILVNASTPIKNGVYEIRTLLDENYVADIAGPSLDNNAELQMWSDCDGENQRFIVESDDNGYYKITSSYSGKVLDTDGEIIFQYSDDGKDSQRWLIVATGNANSYYIINKFTGLYWDCDNACVYDSNKIKQFDRNDGYDAQSFKFTLISESENQANQSSDETVVYEESDGNDVEERCITTIEDTVMEMIDTMGAAASNRNNVAETPIKKVEPVQETPKYCNFYITRYIDYEGEKRKVDKGRYFNECICTFPEIKAKGYKFDGWYDMEGCKSCEEALVRGKKITIVPKGNVKDVSAYAKLSLINYKITYNLDGGKNNATNPTKYNVKSKLITFATPTKTGYVFKGWYKDASLKKEMKFIPANSTGNIAVYAKWEKTTKCDFSKLTKAYPVGTKWGPNTTYGGGRACIAFASKAFNILWGVDSPFYYLPKQKYIYGKSSQLKNVALVSRITEAKSGVTTTEIKNAFAQAEQGQVIQVSRYKTRTVNGKIVVDTTTTPHTMIIEKVTNSGVTVYHGAWPDKVCRTTFTWSDFKSKFLSNPNNQGGVGMSIYRYNK